METVLGTVSEWTGQEKPSFDLNCTLVNYGGNKMYSTDMSIMDILKNLIRVTNPSLASGSGIYVAPGGYSVEGGSAGLATFKDLITTGYDAAVEAVSGSDPGAESAQSNYSNASPDQILAKVGNTWTVKFGRIARIDRLLCDSLSYTISKERLSNGEPLYIDIKMAFTLCYQPDGNLINSWFLPTPSVSKPSAGESAKIVNAGKKAIVSTAKKLFKFK